MPFNQPHATMTKTWVIPDIHGCSETLKLLINNQIRPEKTDHIIFLGDYIDRGPDGKGVLDFIMGLQDSGYNITPLKGNHEAFCEKAYEADLKGNRFPGIKSKTWAQKEWEANGGRQTLESFHTDRPGEIPKKYIDWIQPLDYYIELKSFIAVHAGFNFELEDPFSDTTSMIWIRDYRVKPEKIRHKKLIHGHVPVSLTFINSSIKNESYKFIDLDNGIYLTNIEGYGKLTALELNSMELITQPVIDIISYNTSI